MPAEKRVPRFPAAGWLEISDYVSKQSVFSEVGRIP